MLQDITLYLAEGDQNNTKLEADLGVSGFVLWGAFFLPTGQSMHNLLYISAQIQGFIPRVTAVILEVTHYRHFQSPQQMDGSLFPWEHWQVMIFSSF